MNESPSQEFESTATPSLKENSDLAWLSVLELADDELAFCDPLASLERQKRRMVILEYWNELELDEADDEPLDDPPLDWLELPLLDWLEEPEDCSWLMIKPLIPLPPLHSNFTSPGFDWTDHSSANAVQSRQARTATKAFIFAETNDKLRKRSKISNT